MSPDHAAASPRQPAEYRSAAVMAALVIDFDFAVREGN
jgi:hypothetical protein